jgi:hypothetical protein
VTATVPAGPIDFEALTGTPLVDVAFDCHRASLALVRALGQGRVARGTCLGVPGQHSWAVLGDDCYDPKASIADPTLWSYMDEPPQVWTGTARQGGHRPHGTGSIWQYGRPPHPLHDPIALATDPGPEARAFLQLAAPEGLDLSGWIVLLHSPVEGWPVRQIIEAAYQMPQLRVHIPIDIVGMCTDLNPQELYR